MSEKNLHKYGEAELTANELDMVNGGGYGDLLKPTSLTYRAICACGYQETVCSFRRGKVICPQCKQLILEYKEGQGYR